MLGHVLDDADALLLVALHTHQEAQHPPGPRQAADDIIMESLHQARVHVVGIEFGHATVQFSRLGGVAQRIAPGLLHHPVVIGAQTIGNAQGIKRAGVVGIGVEPRLRQRHGPPDFGQEAPLGFQVGIHLGTPQKGVRARNQLAFQGPVAVHLLEHQRLRQVIVKFRIVRGGRDGLLEIRHGLRVFQVVEVVEALLDQALFGRYLSRRGQGQNQPPYTHSDLFIVSDGRVGEKRGCGGGP